MSDLPRGQGAPIIAYRLQDIHHGRRGGEMRGEWVLVRSGHGWRDMHGTIWPATAILDWAPLIPGERNRHGHAD